jgi:hypothetical protein
LFIMENSAPLGRGQSFFGLAGTVSLTSPDSVAAEGVERVFVGPDGRPLYGRLMRNASSGTILPGFLVTPSTTDLYRKRRFGVVTAGAAAETVGVVDSELPATGVRNNDLCWVFYKGRHVVSISDSQTVDLSVGNMVMAQDEGQCSGLLPTNASNEATLTGASDLMMANKIGRMAEAVTYDADMDGTLAYVDLDIRD